MGPWHTLLQAHLLHVGNIGLPSKSCLPQAGGGPGRAAGVSPGLSPCTQAGQGALAPPAAVKVGKETQSSTPTALDPPGRLVC